MLDGNEGVNIENYPLVESLGAYCGSEIGSYDEISGGEVSGKLNRSPLV